MKNFLSEWRGEALESLKRFGPALLAYYIARAFYSETTAEIVLAVVLIECEIVRPLREILTLARARKTD